MPTPAFGGSTAHAVSNATEINLKKMKRGPANNSAARHSHLEIGKPLAKEAISKAADCNNHSPSVTPATESGKGFLHAPDQRVLRRPAPSLAARKVSGASKAHFTGRMVIPDTEAPAGRILLSESKLEISWTIYLLSLPEVETVIEQVPVIWIDDDGARRTKYFDLVIVFRNGRRVACEVKPEVRLASGRVRRELRKIAAQIHGEFNDVRLLTDKQLCPEAVFNAELFFGMREADPEADAAACKVVNALAGAATLSDLRVAIGLGGRGLRALVRLIAAGRLRLCGEGRIHPSRLVRRAEVA